MKALKKKWNSRQGASILLALLFLLVCMMVGASILMAAASNAGRVRSGKEEQQNYLTLSSTLTLLCGELEQMEYVGKYTYKSKPCDHQVLDADGNSTGEYQHNTDHEYEQKVGILSPPSGWPEDILPFRKNLDYTFANNFRVSGEYHGDDYAYSSLIDQGGLSPTAPDKSCPLMVKAEVGDGYGGLSDQVKVVVELRPDGSIILQASLVKEPAYVMTALLRPDPDQWPQDRLVLSNQPADGAYSTSPIKWKLEYFWRGVTS